MEESFKISNFTSEFLLFFLYPVWPPRAQLILLKIKYFCSCSQPYSLGHYVFMPAPQPWLYWSTYQWNKAQNKPKTLGCSPHSSFWQIYLRRFFVVSIAGVFALFCFVFYSVLFPFPNKYYLQIQGQIYVYVADSLELVSIQVTPPTKSLSTSDPPSTNRTNSWCSKTSLNAKVQCGVTAICWRGVDITVWMTAPRQNNQVTLVQKNKSFLWRNEKQVSS